ncbi:putative membrane protein [Bradyrhizobium sp. USDA 4354]
MFDGPFDVFALIIAIIAFLIAIKASSQATELRRRLNSLEEMLYAQRTVQPPPLMPAQVQAEAPATTAAAEPPPLASEAELAPPSPATADISPPPLEASPEAGAPPPLPAPAPGFEERLGTRWVVWIGGLALALGGFFMVRYSIEAGLLGPGVRVFLGGLFAAALLGAGEWTRRKESISSIQALPIANIPAILTAAGTAVAFATIYAAYALYGFLVPATAFVLLGIVAMGTLAAALLHGPALAGLGVVGAFVTPILVSSGKPDYWALYIYLAVVTAASFGLARIRLWRWLAVTTIVFAVLWIFPGLDTEQVQVAPHAFHVIAGFVLAALLVVCGFMFGPSFEDGEIEPVSSGALGAYLFGAMLIVLSSGHADLALIAFTLLVAGTLFVAWGAPAATGALGAAAATVFIVFAEWAVRANPDMLVLPGGPMPGVGPVATDSAVTLHLVTAAIFAAGFGAAGFFAQGRSSSAIVPVVWSAAGVATPIAILVALYARIAHLDRSIPFAILAVLLAAAFGAATEALMRREERPGVATSVALFATGTLGALALALTFALEKGWLTIALALMSLGTAWISVQRPIPVLRRLAAIFAAIVTARIVYDPRIVGDAIGTTPIFNWLLWGYGLPAASFWGASLFLRRRADDAPLRVVETAAILFTALLAFMEIRHFATGGRMTSPPSLLEFALQVCITLAMAIGLERLRLRSHSIVHDVGAVVLTAIAGLISVFGLLILENPLLLSSVNVGGLVFNLLLLGYALPAVLMLLLSYAVAGHRRVAYANTIAGGALVFALTYVTLEIRRFYHGPVLLYGATTSAEQYTYSIGWLAFGVVLLGVGILVNSERARLASAAVIALTIFKAFAVDVWTLTGVYRALSFMCLGVVLVAIGWLYQRILFRRQVTPPPAVPQTGS